MGLSSGSTKSKQLEAWTGEFGDDYVERTLSVLGEDSIRMLTRYIPDEEVEALFKASDVVVLPYRSATQSGVTHVAYALGCPVITTDVGGLAETVVPGETGLVVPPEDPQALADAITRFFAEQMAEPLACGVEALRASHSWETLADTTMELLDELAPDRGWRPSP